MNHIGPKQRPIIEDLKRGYILYQEDGRWYFNYGIRYLNRERCMGLYTRGFIMADGTEDTRTRYVLTDKGRRV